MPQISVFQCPACGANLSYDGGPELNFPCQFCGTSVIVPPELRPKEAPQPALTPVQTVSAAGAPDLASQVPIDKLNELKQLALSGQEVRAIKLYREIFDTSFTDAHAAVEKLAAGHPLVVTSTQVDVSGAAVPNLREQMADVSRLARVGRKAEAVQLLRQLNPSLDWKDAQAAVNAMAGRGPGASVSREAGAGRRVRTGRAGVLGCFTSVLMTGGILAFIGGMMYLPFRLSGSYQQALEAARADPAVRDALGTPIQVDWWPGTGEISCGGDSCSANYIIPLRGPRSSGRIDVMSDSKGAALFNEGTWILNAVVIVNSGPSIQLTPPPTPALTLSALAVDATQGAAARSTQQAQATQKADATATRVARQAQTATVVAQAAQTATAAAEAQATAQAVIAAQANWPVALSDSFVNNHLGWPTGAEKGAIVITTTVSGKKYAWEVVSKQSAYGNAFPLKTQPFTDFAATAKVKLVGGGEDGQTAFGLVFRHVDQDYGFFGIVPGGHFWVKLTYAASTSQYYVESSPAIHTAPGQINQLTVRVLGPNLIFQINDEVVWQLTDDLPAGDVGLGVSLQGSGRPAKAEFSDFEVRAP
jgi:hypothetical protein